MGQHSQNPSPSGKRRWVAIAAGAAIIATGSTTAWAAISSDDSPKTAAAPNPSPTRTTAAKPADTTGHAATPNEAAQESAPKTTSPAPKPPAGARPAISNSPQQPVEIKTEAMKKPVEARTAATKQPVEAKKPKVRVLSSGTCGASFYDEPQMTASGERFNPSAMTAAHKTLPLGSKVRVTNLRTGKSVTVRINDRGPYVGGRCLDLSAAAFSAIGNTSAGVMRVKYEVLAR